MAVKFEFIVDDVDAQNIMCAIRETALRNDVLKLEYITREDLTQSQKEAYIIWLDSNKEYMLDLITKMKNTRIED